MRCLNGPSGEWSITQVTNAGNRICSSLKIWAIWAEIGLSLSCAHSQGWGRTRRRRRVIDSRAVYMKRVSHSIIILILFCNLKACGVSFYSGAIITPPRAKCRTGKLALRCETDIKFISLRRGPLATSVTLAPRAFEKPKNHKSGGALCVRSLYTTESVKRKVSLSRELDIRHQHRETLCLAVDGAVIFFCQPRGIEQFRKLKKKHKK